MSSQHTGFSVTANAGNTHSSGFQVQTTQAMFLAQAQTTQAGQVTLTLSDLLARWHSPCSLSAFDRMFFRGSRPLVLILDRAGDVMLSNSRELWFPGFGGPGVPTHYSKPSRGCLVSAQESHERDLRRAQYRAGLQSQAQPLQPPTHTVHFLGCGCPPLVSKPSVTFAPMVHTAIYPLTRGEVRGKQAMSEHVEELLTSRLLVATQPLDW
jgi:hypothetical protein